MTFAANTDRIQAEDQTMRVLTGDETDLVSGAGKTVWTFYRNGNPRRIVVRD